jgi:hypothetical protein
MLHACLQGMHQYQHPIIPNTPEYGKLEKEFGNHQVSCVLRAYHNDQYVHNSLFNKWSGIADIAIGKYCVEEQRRYFLVNIMLQADKNPNGLEAIYHSYANEWFCGQNGQYTQGRIDTPNGPIYTQLESWQWTQAMDLPIDIRDKLFTDARYGNYAGKFKSFVLVRKQPGEVTPVVKWSLFKGSVIFAHLITSLLKKDDDDKKPHKKNHSLISLMALSDAYQKIEEDIQRDLETQYPILKTHEVKSLIADKTWWLYDSKKWLLYGSASCMTLLALCFFHDKIPYMNQVISMIIII